MVAGRWLVLLVRGLEDREAWKEADDICGAGDAAVPEVVGLGWAARAGKSASRRPRAATHGRYRVNLCLTLSPSTFPCALTR